ncbi:MAG TPA: DNA repair protein RecN [Gammaproteobacteria bacterium]|nr:DNA repair protein RecN [Gammaproteobacteria bacterium]HIK71540.1 DNA repair protein RecN [Pseudomonadales bacterium]
MLTQITITDLAIVDYLDLPLPDGMSVITGETGVGKSIMLDGLALTLGQRAEINQIASGKNTAEVSAEFDISKLPAARDWLIEKEISIQDNMVLLRRIIRSDGRNRAFINGSPTTLIELKSFGELLIDIHAQHEHQSLLKKPTQRKLLDEYCSAQKLADEVKLLHSHYQENRKQLREKLTASDENNDKLQLLTYQASEITELALEPGELESLEAEHNLLSRAEHHINNASLATELINSDAEKTIIGQLNQVNNLMDQIEDTTIENLRELLKDSIIQIEEVSKDLRRYVERYPVNPARLAEIELRLSQIHNIARKHKIQPRDLAALSETLAAQLKALEDNHEDIITLEQELKSLRLQYQESARLLSELRTSKAPQLEAKVTKLLHKMGMNNSYLTVSLTPLQDSDFRSMGGEEIEFLVSTNPGQAPLPLNKIASGGELSRISLAIQVVTADTTAVPTLVFDEVDVGIGGGIASIVGSLLRDLSNSAQILCVTHLPQVAAQGEHHFKVSKSENSNHTEINLLCQNDRIEEIARMLGGVSITKRSIAHASEMLIESQAGSTSN